MMSCIHMAPLQALVITTLAAVVLLAPMLVVVSSSAKEAPSAGVVYRFELIHHVADSSNDNNGSRFTKDDVSSATTADGTYLETAKYNGRREYLMELRMGTPPKTFKGVVDTGSDVIWTNQVERMCDVKASFSFTEKKCPDPDNEYCNKCGAEGEHHCVFAKSYGGGKIRAEGFMAQEMLTLNVLPPPGKHEQAGQVVRGPISFGCVDKCSGGNGKGDDAADNSGCREFLRGSAEGIVGLNRGPKSLLKQLGVTRLSYCLSDPLKPELSSPLWFGSGGRLELRNPPWYKSLMQHHTVHTTPLVEPAKLSTPVWAYRYYIELEGIEVDFKVKEMTKLPKEGGTDFNHKSVGNKGLMFVDSGCSYSKLESAAFDVLLDLLLKPDNNAVYRVPPPAPNNNNNDDHHQSKACFPASALKVPSERPDLVLHFTDAQMRLPWSTYMSEVKPKKEEEESSGKSSDFCTTIFDSKKEISILGNIQQQNMHMLFNLDANKLQFEKVTDCSTREL